MKILATRGKERHHLFSKSIEHTVLHFSLNPTCKLSNAKCTMQVFVFHFLRINAYKESLLHNFELTFKIINTNKFTFSKSERVEEITTLNDFRNKDLF